MSNPSPPHLFALAIQGLLRDEARAMKALECLPPKLFPAVFSEAISSTSSKTVQAMVQAWPFHCLPLGTMTEGQQPHPDILKAVLDGLDVLLDLDVPPPACKLRVVNLQENPPKDLGNLLSTTKPWNIGIAFQKAEAVQPRTKRRRLSLSPQKQHLLGMQLVGDLCIKEDNPDQVLSFIKRRVNMGKVLPQICCRKLTFIGKRLKFPIIEKILQKVRVDCVQEVKISQSLDLVDLAMLAPYLGQMVHVNTFHLSGVFMYLWTFLTEQKVDKLFSLFISQFVHLHQLQSLHLDSVFCLPGRLDQLLRCVPTNLEDLCIRNCSLKESDLIYLSLCPCTSSLTSLVLNNIILINLDLEWLQALLLRASSTLVCLDLGGCRITNAQLTVILPALSFCAQLQVLRLYGNQLSSTFLEILLRNMLPPSKSRCLVLPIPLDCYLTSLGPVEQGRLQGYLAELRLLLQDLAMCSWSLETHSTYKDDMILLQFEV